MWDRHRLQGVQITWNSKPRGTFAPSQVELWTCRAEPGIFAKFKMPGDNEPSGFILTAILGIVGAFVATFLGQGSGWYRPGEGAGSIGAVVGAVIVLFISAFVAGRRRV
jgi:uncharacterized membrane protein YeaQ/YmgE (transglycosylase-associated protein family)